MLLYSTAMSHGAVLAESLAATTPRIMLVEDDPYVAKYVRLRLEREGFEVDTHANGAEAMQALLLEPLPDLIISDLLMPEVDGLALLQRLRDIDRTASIPMVILSGSATVEDRIECLEKGATDYLSKPIDGSELAARVRVHLRNTSELRRLRQEARFDPLTGALNRRGTLEALEREIDRCRRECKPMTLMLIDADKFKEINDSYGHTAGDQVLVGIAEAIRDCVRLTDVVGRMGGDEFLLALPNVGNELAHELLERIRQSVSARTVPGTDIPVQVSIGMATDEASGARINELFERADRAMYSDKTGRRNTLRSMAAIEPERAALESLP